MNPLTVHLPLNHDELEVLLQSVYDNAGAPAELCNQVLEKLKLASKLAEAKEQIAVVSEEHLQVIKAKSAALRDLENNVLRLRSELDLL